MGDSTFKKKYLFHSNMSNQNRVFNPGACYLIPLIKGSEYQIFMLHAFMNDFGVFYVSSGLLKTKSLNHNKFVWQHFVIDPEVNLSLQHLKGMLYIHYMNCNIFELFQDRVGDGMKESLHSNFVCEVEKDIIRGTVINKDSFRANGSI